jgi:Niemann-Pick C1 protein
MAGREDGHPAARAYAAALLRPRVAAAVLAVAGIAAGASLAALPLMPLGLDQASALPPDSYLAPYFSAVATLLQVGPPVYWVLPAPAPYWSLEAQNALSALPCARAAGDNATEPCAPSLVARLGACGRGDAAEAAHLAGAPNDWLGDYLRWVDPASGLCRTAPNATDDVAHDGMVPAPCAAAGAEADAAGCGVCAAELSEDGATWTPRAQDWQPLAQGSSGPPRPTRAAFEAHLPLFLASRCSAAAQVSLCGTPYTSALDLTYTHWAAAAVAHAADPTGAPHPGPSPGVAASRLAGFHAPLRSQSDFIGGRGAASALADTLAAAMPSTVAPHGLFAYSSWYVFFEQYAGIRGAALAALAAAAACVFAAAAAALRSARAAAAVAAAVASTVLCLAGVSAAAGVSLNALSLVNLSAAAGIATEFCIHIAARSARAAACGATPPEAAAAGLASAGGVVARGVVATKAIGVACLALARTRVFRTYYFVMYAALVALAAAHALAVLPALLALRAPRAWRR